MIKKIVCLFVISSFVIFTSCNKKEGVKEEGRLLTTPEEVAESAAARRVPPADGKYPVLTFEKTEHDFGTIEKDSKVEYYFNFKNTGEADLIITRAMGSCGCTIPEYPKEAIKPGESAKMKVSFNSKGKEGNQQKSVTIMSNTEKGTESISIKASIKE